MDRAVPWEGFANARDLGGLPLRSGGTTAPGVFRSATLRFVTPAGWDDAWAAGVRTVLDLRNDDELVPRDGDPLPGSAVFRDATTTAPPPSTMDRVRVPLRTGLVALLLLSLADVTREAIADDYTDAARTVPSVLAAIGAPDQEALIGASLRRFGTTVHGAALDAADRIDAEAVVRDGGLTDEEIDTARSRLSSHFNV